MPGNSKKVTASSRRQLANLSTNSNGAKQGKQEKETKQAAPQLSEKAKRLALKAFRMTYEAHHGKSSQCRLSPSIVQSSLPTDFLTFQRIPQC